MDQDMSVRKRFSLRASRGLLLAAALIALASAIVPLGEAQVDHSTVLRMLRESRDSRARVRAAMALGGSGDRSVAPALVQALHDESAAVRAAAATSLGRLADPSTIAPLRRVQTEDRDRTVRAEAARAIARIESVAGPDRPQMAQRAPGTGMLPVVSVVPNATQVQWPIVRYVVMLGPMQNRSTFREAELDQVFAREVERSLIVLRGVAVFRDGQQGADVDREVRRRRLSTLRLEGSISRVDRRPSAREVSVRSEVSLILMDHPGRNLRSMLNGAATATQPARATAARPQQERQLAQQALTGAVRSAMSGAARAIASAGRH